MKIFVFILALFISVSGLTQMKEDIVGSWSALGTVCGSAGNFKVMAIMTDPEDSIFNLKIRSEGVTTWPFPDGCEINIPYTAYGSTLSFNEEAVSTSNCSLENKGYLTPTQNDAIVEDGFIYFQIPEGLIQFSLSEGDDLPEGCTTDSVYHVFSPTGEEINISISR